jgi:O-antigen/teichoic acid export membrane protein
MTQRSPRSPRLDAGTTWMLVATILAAVAAYLFLLVVGRILGTEAFAPLTALWTVQGLAFTTIFMPMEQLTVRRLNLDTPGATPWRLYLSVIAAAALGATAFAALTLDRLFTGDPAYLPIMAALIAGYGAFAIGRGYLAGRRRFKEYALCTFSESVLRLVLAGVLLALGVGALGLGWTLAAGSVVVWVWLPLRGERRRAAGAPPEMGAGADLATFVTANAAAQTLVWAGPLVVGGLGAGAAEVSIFFQTFLLLRAPLTVAYNLVSRVLPPFTRWVERGEDRVIRRLVAGIGATGAVLAAGGFAIGWWAGPPLVELLLGAEYRPGPLLAALAATGALLATVALFAQQMLIAQRATGRLAAAWLAGLAAAAVVVILAGTAPSLRVGWGFLVGEALAFALIIVIALTARSRPQLSSG